MSLSIGQKIPEIQFSKSELETIKENRGMGKLNFTYLCTQENLLKKTEQLYVDKLEDSQCVIVQDYDLPTKQFFSAFFGKVQDLTPESGKMTSILMRPDKDGEIFYEDCVEPSIDLEKYVEDLVSGVPRGSIRTSYFFHLSKLKKTQKEGPKLTNGVSTVSFAHQRKVL